MHDSTPRPCVFVEGIYVIKRKFNKNVRHITPFGGFCPFIRITILIFFHLLYSKLAQAREVAQLQNILIFLKSRNTGLSYDMRSYGV